MSESHREAAPTEPLWATTIRNVPTGAFAFVMATGIVSSALADVGQQFVSHVLLAIALAALVVLTALTTLRLIRHRADVLADTRDPARAFGFFTAVAAVNVVGVALYSPGHRLPTIVLAIISVPLWVLFSYGLPGSFILGAHTESVAGQVDGSWFLWVVGTQSVAVAAATVGAGHGNHALADIAVALWGIGVLLYLMLATLVTLRLLTTPGEPSSLNPSYWIYMGATAITVLAGSTILALPAGLPIMVATSAVVSGLTYILWAFGMWWVPLLVVFGVWRHLVHRMPVRYETGLWSIVFPLGMYAAASMHFGAVAKLPYLVTIGRAGAWVAGLAWLIVTVAMIKAALRHSPTR